MYETIAGLPTPGITYAKMLDHLRELQDCMAMMAHLIRTEDKMKDIALANGWLAMAELTRQMELKVTELAQGRLN